MSKVNPFDHIGTITADDIKDVIDKLVTQKFDASFANKKYFVDVVTSLVEKYDNRELTRHDFINCLTSFGAAVHVTTSNNSNMSFRENDPDGSNRTTRVFIKLENDKFGEYEGNDVSKKWAKINDTLMTEKVNDMIDVRRKEQEFVIQKLKFDKDIALIKENKNKDVKVDVSNVSPDEVLDYLTKLRKHLSNEEKYFEAGFHYTNDDDVEVSVSKEPFEQFMEKK